MDNGCGQKITPTPLFEVLMAKIVVKNICNDLIVVHVVGQPSITIPKGSNYVFENEKIYARYAGRMVGLFAAQKVAFNESSKEELVKPEPKVEVKVETKKPGPKAKVTEKVESKDKE